MRSSNRMLAVAAALAVVFAAFAATSASAAKSVRPQAFKSCTAFVSYARANAAKIVGPNGLATRPDGIPMPFASPPMTVQNDRSGGPVPPPAAKSPALGEATDGRGTQGVDFSGTNHQEEGVDEPDIVKTNGAHMFAVSGGKLHAIDVFGAFALRDSLDIEGSDHQFFLKGGRVLVMSRDYGPVYYDGPGPRPLPAARAAAASDIYPGPYSPPKTIFTEVDVSNPAGLKKIRTLTVDGNFVDARLTGSTARVVLASPPQRLDFVAPGSPGVDTPTEATAANKREVRSAGLASWRPSATLVNNRNGHKATRPISSCNAIRRPHSFSGLGMLTILTLDLNKGLFPRKGLHPLDSDGLFTDASTLYGSTSAMYVATQRYTGDTASDTEAPRNTTTLHKFDISDPDDTVFRASGDVRGHLLNQFSLSEHRGYIRAATTDTPLWWGGNERAESESFVTVLAERAGKLVPVGRVGGMGRGERIYSVRFVEDNAFVVTFRQVDPLYTVDLTNPSAPRVVGELKILGYSAYLHPVGKDLLIGVGQDATKEGRRKGAQISLFDVSNLGAPRRVNAASLGDYSSSQVEFDHKAFLYWPPTALAVLPVQLYSSDVGSSFNGAVGFRVARAGISEAGRVSHAGLGRPYDSGIQRSLVVRSRLLTLSDDGVMSSPLGGLGAGPFVAFPKPVSSGGGGTVEPDRPTTK